VSSICGHYVAHAKRAIDGLYGLVGLDGDVKTRRALNLMEHDRFICPKEYRDGERVSNEYGNNNVTPC
jgi:hypothetical protein